MNEIVNVRFVWIENIFLFVETTKVNDLNDRIE